MALKLSQQTVNGCRITPVNPPGGSTLQWDTRRDLLCLASLVSTLLLRTASFDEQLAVLGWHNFTVFWYCISSVKITLHLFICCLYIYIFFSNTYIYILYLPCFGE